MGNFKNVNLDSINLVSLTEDELYAYNGGTIFGDIAYIAGATIKCTWLFCKNASEYQASLPPNLKK